MAWWRRPRGGEFSPELFLAEKVQGVAPELAAISMTNRTISLPPSGWMLDGCTICDLLDLRVPDECQYNLFGSPLGNPEHPSPVEWSASGVVIRPGVLCHINIELRMGGHRGALKSLFRWLRV